MIFENKYFKLFSEDEDVLISIYGPGYDLKSLSNDVLIENPRIQITNFLGLKHAVDNSVTEPTKIGKIRPLIEVILSSDKMEARIKINVSKTEFEEMEKDLPNEIIRTLESEKVTYGILHDALKYNLEPLKEIVVAKGVMPVNGHDSTVKYIDMADKKPTIKEDDRVDYYELNFIKQVNVGELVGEKVVATPGEPGKTVTDEILLPRAGKDTILRYDNKTITEITLGNKIFLKALVDGAVAFIDGKIKILNHLIIEGDVDFQTGNINFNGYVTVKGTINDGFSVRAEKDISILSETGIGAVDEIKSLYGDIYIKGGISGKGKANIQANKTVYVKFVKDCTITAGENINIGLYSIDSNLYAKNIFVNSEKGRIIGGSLNAEAKVSVYTIGNASEKKTYVNVKGFDRQAIKTELDDLLVNYKKCLLDLEQNKRQMKIYEVKVTKANKDVPSDDYKAYAEINDNILKSISKLDDRRKTLMEFLESKGEGEVTILKTAYPQTYLDIKNIQKRIERSTNGTFYTINNKLHFS